MRLVVTGRNGQVVRALRELSDQSATEIVTLGRPELDLAVDKKLDGLFRPLRPDVIVNAAAYTAVDRAETERDAAFSINAGGAGRVAEAAARLNVPIVQLSTDYVFNGNSAVPYVESSPAAPINFYGLTKLAGETAVQKANPNHVILRTSWVYAPFGQNFVLTMLRLGKERSELTVVDDQRGTPTSAFDIASAIVEIAKHLLAKPEDRSLRGIFHFTNQGETTWAGFASEIFRLAEQRSIGPFARIVPIPSSQYPTAAKRPASSRLDISKIAGSYRIIPAHWPDALRDVISRIPARLR